jgi:hypothetical protein
LFVSFYEVVVVLIPVAGTLGRSKLAHDLEAAWNFLLDWMDRGKIGPPEVLGLGRL